MVNFNKIDTKNIKVCYCWSCPVIVVCVLLGIDTGFNQVRELEATLGSDFKTVAWGLEGYAEME